MATYLITGANRGIGYEYCRQLQKRGDEVIAVCRHSSDELEALSKQAGVRVETGVDIGDESAVVALVETLDSQPIDVLINNAGIYRQSSLASLDINGIRKQFEVNAIAPLNFTKSLLPNLTNGSKIAIMTSRMGSITDNSSGGSYGYRMSKVAVSMAGRSLAHDLKAEGIAVAILHPGWVSTRMTDFTERGISPEQSVSGLLARIDELTLSTTGTFWHANGEVLPW
ncbi:MAG: SDR family oxidoreductase [Phormidesmis sp.]